MSNTAKKTLVFIGLGLDIAITVFLFVISIILLVKSFTMSDVQIRAAEPGLITTFQQKPNLFLGVCVIPLFVLLAGNITGLVVYIKKTEKKPEVKVSDLSEEQKEALKKQLLEELSKK